MELFFMIGVLFAYLILFTISLLFILWLLQSILFPAPFLPLPNKVVEHLCNMVNLPEEGYFYDLGSGDGRVVRAMAIKYPNASCIGVEKALLPTLLAKTHSMRLNQNNTKYLKQDYSNVSLARANVVFLYLWPQAMEDIVGKLKQELPKQAVVLSCRFPLADREADNIEVVVVNSQEFVIYAYKATSL